MVFSVFSGKIAFFAALLPRKGRKVLGLGDKSCASINKKRRIYCLKVLGLFVNRGATFVLGR